MKKNTLIIQVNIEAKYLNLNFNVPSKIPVVFHNVSNYDCHFIIKELANEFQTKSECLGENTEKKSGKLFHSNRKMNYKN